MYLLVCQNKIKTLLRKPLEHHSIMVLRDSRWAPIRTLSGYRGIKFQI